MNQEQINILAGKSGQSTERAPRYEVPTLRINGNTGEVTKSTYVDNERVETTVSTPIEAVFLRNHKIINKYVSATKSYFSLPFRSFNHKTVLYLSQDGKTTVKGSDTYSNLKEANPIQGGLREVVYALVDGEVVAIEFKGVSLGAFYDYRKLLEDEGINHSFQVKTVLTVEDKTTENGSFKGYSFAHQDNDVDFETINEKMTEASEGLEAVYAYNTKKLVEQNGSAQEETVTGPSADDIDF